MKNQIKYTEEILFNNYMVSALGEEYVHSQIPFFIEKKLCENMKYYGEEVNRISLEVLNNINGKHKDLLKYFDDFPLKKMIFSLRCSLSPMYWTRYDTFIDKEDNIYFSEFNYDKPCGQKEINIAEKCDFKGNLNKGFIERLIKFLLDISEEFCDSSEKMNVGFLIDPCHYEELHHSYFFKEIFKESKINIIPVGNNNLSVKDGYVYGFSKEKIQIILRLFPTEFFHEINNIEEILDSFNNRKVLILNDPRIIAIQSKGFFAYLWDLIKKDSNTLNEHDKDIIRRCIPYTEILDKENAKEVLQNKDRYVVKSSLGRYSEEVYIGKSYEEDEWKEQIRYILESKKIHIVQDLINIRQEYTYGPDYKNRNTPILAYGNFGVYIMDRKVEGYLVRWSRELLTDDNYTWMSPLGKDEYPLKIERSNIINEEKRQEIYEELNEELSFKYDFTGAYTNSNEYISLDKMIIKRSLFNEIENVGSKFCEILKKIYPHIQSNLELFGPILGIPESLYNVVTKSSISKLCALGRIDFVVDNFGNLKILEFNSETPAGIVESIGINSILKTRFDVPYDNPNENLRESIKSTLKNIIEEIKKNKSVKNIAVVTSWYYEDIYNTKIISDIIKECGDFHVIFGNIYDMKVKNKKIYLYGQEIDAIYRYYPLDWFYYEEEMRKLIEPLSVEEYLINPGHTIITQSKALFAVLYEIVGRKVLNNDEEAFIKKYMPYTSLEKDAILSNDYLAKPYLSREGEGIVSNFETIDNDKDYIFQDRVNIRPLRMNVYSSIRKEEKFQFPIIGAYIAGDKVAGIYTRIGEFITDVTAKYISSYIE